jgi:hypothetical protein
MKRGETLAAGGGGLGWGGEAVWGGASYLLHPLKSFDKLRKSQPFIDLQTKLCIKFNVII